MQTSDESDRAFYAQLVSRAGDVMIDALRRAGLQGDISLPSYDELVASGAIKISELRLMSMNFVTPGWDRPVPPKGKPESRDKPFSVIPGGKETPD